jgi:outer membrane immunogenic protein
MKSTLLAAVTLVALGTPAFAADLGRFRSPAISPLYDWSGSYVGLQAGYSRDHQDYAERGYGDLEGENYYTHDSVSAFVGGGHAGYNFQRGRLVYGIEGDLEYDAARNTVEYQNDDWGYEAKMGLQGSARLRLGYAFDHLLVYGTAGLAVGEFSFKSICDWCGLFSESGATESGSMHQTRVGWTAGAGLQYALNDRLSVRTEYRYTDFGSQTEDVSEFWDDPYRDTFSLTSHSVRLGVSYALGK